MDVKLLVISNFSVLISNSGADNFYCFKIVDSEEIIHSFEGIYPTLEIATNRCKAVVENLHNMKST